MLDEVYDEEKNITASNSMKVHFRLMHQLCLEEANYEFYLRWKPDLCHSTTVWDGLDTRGFQAHHYPHRLNVMIS